MGHSFATRLQNVFVIGKGTKPWVSLPKGRGLAALPAERLSRVGSEGDDARRVRTECSWGAK